MFGTTTISVDNGRLTSNIGMSITRLLFLTVTAIAFFAVPSVVRAGTVNGTLFIELNADGVRQSAIGETGSGGLTINLMTPGPNGIPGDGDDVVVATDATGGIDGSFSFTSVAAGTYYLHADITPFIVAFLFSPKDQGGDDALDSDFDPTTGNTTTFSLGAAATVTRDLGLIPIRTRSASGTNTAAIQSTVDNFRSDLGTLNPNQAGSANGGRREINWDGVPAQFAAPNNMPADFFNVNSPRGVVFTTAGTGFQVSGATGDSGSAGQPAAARFGNLQATYTANFQTFSPQRLFTPLGSNVMDVTFFVPGSTTPAFSLGFGAVFTDVEHDGATTIELFNQNGASLGRRAVPVSPNGGLSFFGISFVGINSRVISKVRIISGEAALGAVEGANDLVVMDDFIYGEPVPNANLVVTAADSPDPVLAGNNVTYTLTLTNDGTGAAQNVTLTDPTPLNMTFVSLAQASGPTFTIDTSGPSPTATIATFAAGATATFTYIARVNSNALAGTAVNNSPRATSNPPDTVDLDNRTVVITTINAQADVSVTKTGPANATVGSNVTYNLTVANAGPSDAQTAALADVVPANLTFVSFVQNSGPAFSLTTPAVGGAGTVTASRGSLAAGTSANFTLVLQITSTASINSTITNTATFSTATNDVVGGNNSSSTSLTVLPPTLTINDVSVTEGNSNSTNATFTVTLSNAIGTPVSVDFFTSNGTAMEPSDYTAVNGTVTFAPGQTTRTINVAVNGDTQVEPNQTFFVNLANPTNADIVDGQGTGTINDDDSVNVFQFSTVGTSVSENAGSVTLTVTRTGDTSGVGSVKFETSDATAKQRSDYTFGYGTIQFGPGESSKELNVLITNDVNVESAETFQVVLSNPSGSSSIGSPGAATITINDDDVAGAANPIDDAGFFVRQHYLDFLGREADASGFAFWTNNITACGSNAGCVAAKRVETSASFFLSIEFQETGGYALRLQRTAFGRQSNDPFTRYPYLQFMRDSRTMGAGVIIGQPGAEALLEQNKQKYAEQAVLSNEFTIRFPLAPAAAYVDALFASAGVTPSAAERTAAINAFGAGGTSGRVSALRSVTDSASVRAAEARISFVLAEYFGYLRRNPTDAPDFSDAGYQFWLDKLNQFNGNFIDAEMVKAFITSIEYRQRFGP